MNPVYSIDEGCPEVSVTLKVLVIDARTCLLDSLAQAINNNKDVAVSVASSIAEARDRYPGRDSVRSGFVPATRLQSANQLRPSDRDHGGQTRSEPPGTFDSRSTPFDVLLYCLGGRSLSVVEQDVEALRAHFGDCQVALVTEQQEGCDADLVSLVDADDVAAVIPASYSTVQLVNCLRLVHSGVQFVPVELQPSAPPPGISISNGAISKKLEKKLTPRQREVLEYVSLGKSNKYIAAELSLCESTVKVHVHEVMKRLGATSRTHASYIVNTLYRADAMEPDSSLMTSHQRNGAALAER